MEDYEKKYKEALERAKSLQHDNAWVTTIFPELKESEDEKIRKTLIHIVKGAYSGYGIKYQEREISEEKLLAWLEKQGESKPIGKLQLSEELYEHIRNTCACIDDALSSETLADINDYLSMANHSARSAFDMIEKQRKQESSKTEQLGLKKIADEDIRKRLYSLVDYANDELLHQYCLTKEGTLDWLEKQGEQECATIDIDELVSK